MYCVIGYSNEKGHYYEKEYENINDDVDINELARQECLNRERGNDEMWGFEILVEGDKADYDLP